MLHPLSQTGVFIYSSLGKWAFPLSCGVFLSLPLLQALLLLVAAGCVPPLLHSLARLVYLQFCEALPLPTSSMLRAPCPLCYVSFLLLLLIIQFFFFPGLGVSLSRELC
jgi:hypothetical protein